MKDVVSAGGVVLRKNNEKIEILMVYNPSFDGWQIPKGHIEENENILEAAKREVREETGLNDFEIVSKLGIVTRLTKEKTGEIVNKHIHLFIFKTNVKTNPIPIDKKHRKTQWFSIDDAIEKLYFEEEIEFMNKHKTQLNKI